MGGFFHPSSFLFIFFYQVSHSQELSIGREGQRKKVYYTILSMNLITMKSPPPLLKLSLIGKAVRKSPQYFHQKPHLVKNVLTETFQHKLYIYKCNIKSKITI